MSKGFATYAAAPSCVARTRSRGVFLALTTTTAGGARPRLELCEHGPAVHHRQHQVEQNQVGLLLRDAADRRGSVGRKRRFETRRVEVEPEHQQGVRFVFDDHDAW